MKAVTTAPDHLYTKCVQFFHLFLRGLDSTPLIILDTFLRLSLVHQKYFKNVVSTFDPHDQRNGNWAYSTTLHLIQNSPQGRNQREKPGLLEVKELV